MMWKLEKSLKVYSCAFVVMNTSKIMNTVMINIRNFLRDIILGYIMRCREFMPHFLIWYLASILLLLYWHAHVDKYSFIGSQSKLNHPINVWYTNHDIGKLFGTFPNIFDLPFASHNWLLIYRVCDSFDIATNKTCCQIDANWPAPTDFT